MADDLLLVKNLHNDRVIFYWVNRRGKRLSTVLHTQDEACEWWKKYMFSHYQGSERRRSVFDRRCCSNTRQVVGERLNVKIIGKGRRATDKALDVDIDLYQKRVQAMISNIN